jgi:hypothetical protein
MPNKINSNATMRPAPANFEATGLFFAITVMAKNTITPSTIRNMMVNLGMQGH